MLKLKDLVARAAERLVEAWDEGVPFEYGERPLPHPRGDDVVTLDVPGYWQAKSYTCGYVAGMSVLHWFKPRASDVAFYRRCAPDTHGYVSETRLVRALRASGLKVASRAAFSWAEVKKAIDAGKPIITTVRGGEHWVVLYGYGLKPNRVFLANNRDTELSWAELLRSQRSVTGGLICSLPRRR